MEIRGIQSGFVTGEVSPKMLGQVDLAQYQFACETLQNFLVWPQGMISLRPGTRFVAAAGDSSHPVRIIPFEFSLTQAYVIEAGHEYFRFYKDQGQILDGSVPYEIEHFYDSADLFDIHYCQSADVLFMAHSEYPPYSLSRLAHTNWILSRIWMLGGPCMTMNDTAITLTAASTSAATRQDIEAVADNGSGAFRITITGHGYSTGYKVGIGDVNWLPALEGVWTITVIDANTFDLDSSTYEAGYVDNGFAVYLNTLTASASLFQSGHWDAIWKLSDTGWVQSWQYNSATELLVETRAAVPGGAVTNWYEGCWSEYRGYPSVVGFYENRLGWGASTHQPATLWFSKSGDYYNHLAGDEDSDPLTLTLNSDHVNAIKWMSSTKVLLVGTSRGQWHVSATGSNEAMTPSNGKASQETNLTSSTVMCRCDHTVLFWQRLGRHLMEVTYSLEQDSYVSTPMTILADHIGQSAIREMVYLQEPLGALFCIREDGEMAVMTYERQHKVTAWSRFVTDGLFESIASIPGSDRDELWVVVNRTVGGSTVRYIELFEDLEVYEGDTEDVFFVDSGLTYDDTATKVIAGFDHLIGEEVAILGDGGVMDNATVDEYGQVTLPLAVSKAQIGLPFTGVVKPVRLEHKLQGQTIQDRRQRVVTIGIRFYKSWAGQIGESLDKLEEITFKLMGDYMDEPITLFSGDMRVQFPGSFNRAGQVYIVQELPLPMNIMAIMPRIDISG